MKQGVPIVAKCSQHTSFQESCEECRTCRSANANASASVKNEQNHAAPDPRSFNFGAWILLGLLAVILIVIMVTVARAVFTVLLGLIQQLAMLLPVGAIAGGIYLWKRRSQAHPWEQLDRVALAGLVAGLIWVLAAVVSETAGILLGSLAVVSAVVAAWLTYRLDTSRIEQYWPHDSPWPTVLQDRLNAFHTKHDPSASAPRTDASQAPPLVTDSDDAAG
jgi:uncharacterized membrane protein HdeD (DUF308 family)